MKTPRIYFDHNYRFFLIIVILFQLILSTTNIKPSNAIINDPQATVETIDLEISRNITIENRLTAFSEFKTLYQLTNKNKDVFTVFTIRNSGHELKKVTVTITIEDYEWEQVFSNKENLLDINYDFSLTNQLVIQLNELEIVPAITSIHVSFSLEYYLSVTEISASFMILNTKLVQVSEVTPSDVFIIPDRFQLRLSSSESLQYRNRFVLNMFILTNLSSQNTLYVTLSFNTLLLIEAISVLGATMTSTLEDIRNFHKVELILDKNVTSIGFQLKMVEIAEDTVADIALIVDSASLSYDTSPYGNGFFQEVNLPAHPIPPELMFFAIVLVLFGVPSYLVYKHQEQEAKKRLNILWEK